MNAKMKYAIAGILTAGLIAGGTIAYNNYHTEKTYQGHCVEYARVRIEETRRGKYEFTHQLGGLELKLKEERLNREEHGTKSQVQ
ncbi:MAG: hypothetical protein QXW00_01490, partial [Candidatus Woesearchaeota archaeon]